MSAWNLRSHMLTWSLTVTFYPGTSGFNVGTGPGMPGCSYATGCGNVYSYQPPGRAVFYWPWSKNSDKFFLSDNFHILLGFNQGPSQPANWLNPTLCSSRLKENSVRVPFLVKVVCTAASTHCLGLCWDYFSFQIEVATSSASMAVHVFFLHGQLCKFCGKASALACGSPNWI